MARTAGRRTWQPWPLAQARQIRPATPVVPEPGPGRQSLLKQPERRKPNRRSGRDPGRRPYAPAKSKPGRQGRKHCTHPPCRIGCEGRRSVPVRVESLCAVRETTTTSLRDRPADKVSGKRMACDTRSARGPMSPSQRTVRGALPIRLRLCLAPDGLAAKLNERPHDDLSRA